MGFWFQQFLRFHLKSITNEYLDTFYYNHVHVLQNSFQKPLQNNEGLIFCRMNALDLIIVGSYFVRRNLHKFSNYC